MYPAGNRKQDDRKFIPGKNWEIERPVPADALDSVHLCPVVYRVRYH